MRRLLVIFVVVAAALSACTRADESADQAAFEALPGEMRAPKLMRIKPSKRGLDEFAVLPPKPLEIPGDLNASLPEPTPGGANLTDRAPRDDAILALGGKPDAGAAGEAALTAYTMRFGQDEAIRQRLAQEDILWRRKNRGRPLERLIIRNVYFQAYEAQSLDQRAAFEFWRAEGVKTPNAPR